MFYWPPTSNEIVRAISFYVLQEFHLMTDKFHLMTEPTIPLIGTPIVSVLLNEGSFSIMSRRFPPGLIP